MKSHDLTRKAESDACAFLFGRIERNENLLLAFLADRMAVIGHIDDDMFRKIDFGGYLDVLENQAFLADILNNLSVSINAHQISVRTLGDKAEWNYVLTQKDADVFMKIFAGFHDSTIERINYSETNGTSIANIIFDNSGWFGVVELCFEATQMLKIIPAAENYSRELYEASLIVEKESIFWADSYMEHPNDSHEGSIIKALNLKWRKL